MFVKLVSRVLPALGLALAAALSHGAIVLRTGVDSGGSVMAPGSTDTHWRISVDNKQTYTDTKVLYPLLNPSNYLGGGQICCGMETVASTAAWISDPSVTATTSSTLWGVQEDVWIETTFSLAGYDLNSVALSGAWRIADYSLGVYLNGQLIPGTSPGYGTWIADISLSVAAGSSLFVDGTNKLEFRAQSVNSGWDGLWFDGTVTGRQVDAQVPVPQTLGLVLTGLAALAWRRRRA